LGIKFGKWVGATIAAAVGYKINHEGKLDADYASQKLD
jgi:hypothetical protein